MKKRQNFLTESSYAETLAYYLEEENYWSTHSMESDSSEQEASLKARRVQQAYLKSLILQYTGGESIDALHAGLEKLIHHYELYQRAIAIEESLSCISPLPLDDWPDAFEEAMQVISMCILLHRTDLLARFVALIDQAGYAGQDTLYEDLLRPLLPNRQDVDEWYHDVYTSLIRAIYADSKQEASQLLKQYCEQWYPAFEQAPWHDSHLDGEDGSYVGYWAFEAAAIAFLYNIDDSKIDHMVYPKDLVAYARARTVTGATQIPRIEAGQPCTHSGFWFTPAQANSRRHFKQGELMPSVSDSNWGDTLWYWAGADSQ